MTESRTLPPEALNDWSSALAERFGLAEGDIPISLILDLARDVANGVARPAAPLSAFVAGLVAGRAGLARRHRNRGRRGGRDGPRVGEPLTSLPDWLFVALGVIAGVVVLWGR